MEYMAYCRQDQVIYSNVQPVVSALSTPSLHITAYTRILVVFVCR